MASTLPAGPGARWQIAVGVPISNPFFSRPAFVTTTFDGAHASSDGTSVDVGDDLMLEVTPVITNAPYRGDVLTFGPSTASGYEGRVETRIITAVTAAVLTVDSNLSYGYADGDPITGWGTRHGAGWNLYVNGVATNVPAYSSYTQMQNFCSPSCLYGGLFPAGATWGYFDGDSYTAQFFRTNPTTTTFLMGNVPVSSYRFPNGFGTGAGLGTKIRYGCAAIGLAGTAAEILRMHFHCDGNTSHGGEFEVTNGAADEWAFATYSYNAYLPTTIGGCGIIFFQYGTTDLAAFRVDCVFAEHTDGLSTWNTGYHTLTSPPQVSDIQRYPAAALNSSLIGAGFVPDPSGAAVRGSKYAISGRLLNLDADDWAAIRILERWQARGHVLNLHTGLVELPPTVQGYFVFDQIDKFPHYNLNYRSLSFTFLEA